MSTMKVATLESPANWLTPGVGLRVVRTPNTRVKTAERSVVVKNPAALPLVESTKEPEKLRSLTSEEFKTLFYKNGGELYTAARNGDTNALNDFLSLYTPLLKRFSASFATQHIPFEERYSLAMERLYVAFQTYIPEKGYRFSTYCTRCVRSAFLNQTRESNRISSKVQYVTSSYEVKVSSEAEDASALVDLLTGETPEYFSTEIVETLRFLVSRSRGRIKPRYWEMWYRYYFKDESSVTIASDYGVAYQVISRACSRVNAELKALADKYEVTVEDMMCR